MGYCLIVKPRCLERDDHHLEAVAPRLYLEHHQLVHLALVEAEGAGEVADYGAERDLGDQVGEAGRELSLQV